ncbi:amino acid ABC transporter [Paenibacillus sp. CCS19]|uniref:ABC transporter substrate-binding protein n=1 Tax=Paenibacillus sp. CCS19 TaxID=3158387 RepID=UPI002569C0AA|nr:ABC transporter substrate-binding protein [Paenibacillus cellulosilyticus]GMK39015.1 amino acid ABC transporter [Paenibacillus cellulosilyticus]
MRRWITVLLLTAMVITIVGCGSKEDKLASIKESGKLVLGTSADYPPYEFHHTKDGKDQIVGFDISIAQQIAKDLGVELEIQDMKFEGLLLALNSNKVDLIISGMTPTAERAKSVDFTNVYYTAEQGVLVSKEAAASYQTFDDLKGKRIGVQKGSLQEGIAKGIEGAKLTSLGKISELVMELQSGRVDAVMAEMPVTKLYASSHPELTLTGIVVPTDQEGSAAIAVKKNNKALVDALNESLDKLKQNGSLDQYIVEANNLLSE